MAEEVEKHPQHKRREKKPYAYKGKKAKQKAHKALYRFKRTAA